MLKRSDPQFSAISCLIAAQVFSTGELVPHLQIRELSKTRNSRVFLANGEGLVSPVLVKQMASGNCRTQYESLIYAHRVMAGEEYRVPVPLGYDEPTNTLFMEYVGGTALADFLTRMSANMDKKLDYIGRTATWLARFHSRTRTEDVSVEASRRLVSVRDSIGNVENMVGHDSEIASAFRFLTDNSDYMDSIRMPACTTHGDCKPENFIVSKNSVVGIDLDVNENGLSLMDAAQFANHITFLSMRLSGLVNPSGVVQLARHFIRSYSQGNPTFNADVLKWLRISHYLRYWAAEAERGGLLGRAQAAVLRRLLINELGDAT